MKRFSIIAFHIYALRMEGNPWSEMSWGIDQEVPLRGSPFKNRCGHKGTSLISFHLLNLVERRSMMGDLILKSGDKIVFIGDSITDCGRRKEFPPLGNGYVFIAHNLTTVQYPERDILWVNKGISGDTVEGLVRRWDEDVINEKPNWVSIYIGINDVARNKNSNRDLEDLLRNFEELYRQILNRTKREIKAGIIMFDVFYVASEDVAKRGFDVSRYNKIIHSLAKEYGAILVETDAAFQDAVKKRPNSQWTTNDGVHPSPLGHTLIALNFLKSIGW
jgi:lysophospholipase L1-like esterase